MKLEDMQIIRRAALNDLIIAQSIVDCFFSYFQGIFMFDKKFFIFFRA